ncbi:hydrophobin [Fusarium sporotrichioides]|uniref:Hydrophobin n=1 Tax=Fusarium sporotrichioides TaxID=5514 RepID=A0A395SK73_FUSSP|nr:hydrophobin [Fusarium sporotrichioides]
MQLSTLFIGVAMLQGAFATPFAEAAVEVETRDIVPRAPTVGDLPLPRLPALRRATAAAKKTGKDCPSSPPDNQQGNACSSGTQFCCTTDGNGVQTCSNSEVCNAKIICCNNNSGFQMCIGEIDFNAPVTININIIKGGKGKGGKGKGYKA